MEARLHNPPARGVFGDFPRMNAAQQHGPWREQIRLRQALGEEAALAIKAPRS